MNIIKTALLGVCLLPIALAACTASSEPAAEISPTMAAAPAAETEAAAQLPTSEPTEAPVEPTATSEVEEPTLTPAPPALVPTADAGDSQETAVAASVDHCLACHMDKAQVIASAAPPEEKPPSESSGVG